MVASLSLLTLASPVLGGRLLISLEEYIGAHSTTQDGSQGTLLPTFTMGLGSSVKLPRYSLPDTARGDSS